MHPTKRLAVISYPVDFCLMGGGSLLLLPLFWKLQSPTFNNFILEASVFLMWFGNWPHFASTLFRLYGNRENSREYPVTSFLLPIVILIFVALSLRQPETIGSALVKLYTLWAPYHFCGQSLGIALFYCRRAGIFLSPWERKSLSATLYSAFLILITRGESVPWVQHFSGISFSSLEISPEIFKIACAFGALSTGSFLMSLVYYKRRLPVLAILPVLSQMAWFLVGPLIGPISPYEQLIPLFHSVQYLPIVWLANRADSHSTLSWYRSNFILGALLFWGIPRLFLPLGIALTIAKPIVMAAINLHHFIVDGVVWKLRNPRVANSLNLAKSLNPIVQL